jgi:hypothetical protein
VVSQIRNHNKRRNCSLEVDVWVSSGSDIQNAKGTQLDLSWFRLLSPTSSNIVIFVLGMPNRGYNGGNRERLVGDAILEFVDVLP